MIRTGLKGVGAAGSVGRSRAPGDAHRLQRPEVASPPWSGVSQLFGEHLVSPAQGASHLGGFAGGMGLGLPPQAGSCLSSS